MKTPTPNLSELVNQIGFHKGEIAKHRDALRQIREDIEALEDPLTQGIEALEQAVEHFSEQL